MQNKERGQYLTIIIHCTHYPTSQWLRAYSLFWKSAQPTD